MLYSTLFPAQKKAVRFSLRNPGTCLFFDQGTGKTRVCLSVIEEEALDDASNYQAIVVCLKTNLFTTWIKSAKELIPLVNVETTLPEFLKLPFPRALFINYEAINAKLRAKLARISWSFAAFDEAQRLKKRSSLSSRIARDLRNVPRRIAMSGTPFDKNPTDLWSILRFVNYKLLGKRGVDKRGKPVWVGDSWPAFFKKYLKNAGFMGYGHKFRSKSLEEKFLDIAAEITLRVERDILGLKGSTFHPPVKFELDPLQREFYDALERDLVVEFDEDGIVSTPMKATLQIKLHQITGGFVIDDDGEAQLVGRAKIKTLAKLLGRLEQSPVVVFYVYKQEGEFIMRLLRRMYDRVAQISGAIKDKKRTKARTDTINAFQRGEIDAMAVQQRTGGVGVDLFESCLGVFYSSTHSWIDFEQAKSRLERYGQKNYVDFFYLMAENTVDEDRLLAVTSKCKLNEATFRRLKRRNIMALKPSKSKDTKTADKKADAKGADKATKTSAKAEAKATASEFKYGVNDLAKILGHSDPASTRVALRKHGIEKAGKSYGWNSKDDLEAVAKKIKAGAEKDEPAKGKDAKKDKKKS